MTEEDSKGDGRLGTRKERKESKRQREAEGQRRGASIRVCVRAVRVCGCMCARARVGAVRVHWVVPWPWHLRPSIALVSQESRGRGRELTGDSAIPVIPDEITARTLARKPGWGGQGEAENVQRKFSK